MMMENFVEWRLAGETEVLGENLPSATLSTTNLTWPDTGRRGGKPATNRLRYGPASRSSSINKLIIASLLIKQRTRNQHSINIVTYSRYVGRSPPPPRWRGGPGQDTPFPASGNVTGTATATLTGSATYCDVIRDNATGNWQRYKSRRAGYEKSVES
jgi:hypothetical protein